jgi:hypothetical protein
MPNEPELELGEDRLFEELTTWMSDDPAESDREMWGNRATPDALTPRSRAMASEGME